MTDWMEIFRAGNYGEKGSYTESDLDQIVTNYDVGFRRAPVVKGHPQGDSEAYGWIEALRREGKSLYAKVKDWAPDFLQKIGEGRYRKRSISIYNNLGGRGLYLRHVGFVPIPEVKGLADLSFFDQQSKVVSFEFDNQPITTEGVNMSEKTALQLLKSVLDFSESESGELSSKIDRARQEIKREITSGPVVPVSNLETAVAAQVLCDEEKISFGQALSRIKGANLEQ
jgi:phage I-like protein